MLGARLLPVVGYQLCVTLLPGYGTRIEKGRRGWKNRIHTSTSIGVVGAIVQDYLKGA
jgi:hypothetical protein